MTPLCELFLKSVIHRNWWQAYSAVGGLASADLFYAVAALDPADRALLRGGRADAVGANARLNQVRALNDLQARLAAPKTGLASVIRQNPQTELQLGRIDFAVEVVATGAVPAVAPAGLRAGDLAAAAAYVGRPFAHPLLLPFEHDLTGMLPPANPGAPVLTDRDFQEAADELGIEAAAIHAVAAVESRGRGFHDGRPTLRYELHIFQKGFKEFTGTGGIYHASHPHLSQPNLAAGEKYHDGTQDREYSLLHAAMILSNDGRGRRYADAWKSASWGRFQVIGFNYAGVGWGNLEGFVASMYESEKEHLQAFLGYVKLKNLTGYIRDRNWFQFANHYNSDGKAGRDNEKVNDYAARMEAAYRRFRRPQPAGR